MEISANLTNLPKLILNEIFNKLDDKGLHNIKNVCKRFYLLSNELIFSKKLQLLKIEKLSSESSSKKLCQHYKKIYRYIANEFNLTFKIQEDLFDVKQKIDLKIPNLWEEAFSDISNLWLSQFNMKTEVINTIVSHKLISLLSADVKAFTQWKMFKEKALKDYLFEAIHFGCEPEIIRKMLLQGGRIEFYHVDKALGYYQDSFVIELIDAINPFAKHKLYADDLLYPLISPGDFLADPNAIENLLLRTINGYYPYEMGKIPYSEELVIKLIKKICEDGTRISLRIIHNVLSSGGIRNIDTILFTLLDHVDVKIDKVLEHQNQKILEKVFKAICLNYACLDEWSSTPFEKMKSSFPTFFEQGFIECINENQFLRNEHAFIALTSFIEPAKIVSWTFCWALSNKWSHESLVTLLPLIDKEWIVSSALQEVLREKPSVALIKTLFDFGCKPTKDNLNVAITGVSYIDDKLRHESKACDEIVILLIDVMNGGDLADGRCLCIALEANRSDQILIKIINKLEKVSRYTLELAKKENRSEKIVKLINRKVPKDLHNKDGCALF